VRGRSVVVKKLKPLPIEAVVRGYIIGSGWKDYQKTGKVCGIELPKGLQQAQKLPEPIFTPATKAETGHDENISFAEVVKLIGKDKAEKVREISIRLYKEASEFAAKKGIIIADTKFEFGLNDKGRDRADRRGADRRFVALLAGGFVPGGHVAAFVRQAIRARLSSKRSTGTRPRRRPKLPAEVITRTSKNTARRWSA
jgi:phosphoribosylaminoimidazole-succinocarboxamide synthase